MRRAILIVVFLGCGTPTAEDHCAESCRFYTECDPELEPLEEVCLENCLARFGDPKQITATCELSEPWHPIDQFRELPSLEKSAIEAGQCALDQGCPPEMPEMNATDPCQGIERICLDTLTSEQRCNRRRDIASYDCWASYQECIDRTDFPTCQSQLNSCQQRPINCL